MSELYSESSQSVLDEESQNSLISRNAESGWPDLPERDRAFAVEYITNGYRHSDAAEAVGLARSSGIGKLRNPLIGGFIRFLQDSSQNSKLITQHFVEQKYLEILPKLMGEEEVEMVDLKDGATFRAKKFHSAEVVGVLRDLGKSTGYTAPEVGSSATVNVQVNLGDLAGDDSFRPNVKVTLNETTDDE